MPDPQVGDDLLNDYRLLRLEVAARKVLALNLGGRWRWRGGLTHGRAPWLSTTGNGWQAVMQFARIGMSGGQPVFPHRPPEQKWSWMVKAAEVPVFEVDRCALDVKDESVYRDDLVGLRTPVAVYMAEADPETVLALVEEIRALREVLVFADGRSVTGGYRLADLYASDSDKQGVMARAGCHPRTWAADTEDVRG